MGGRPGVTSPILIVLLPGFEYRLREWRRPEAHDVHWLLERRESASKRRRRVGPQERGAGRFPKFARTTDGADSPGLGPFVGDQGTSAWLWMCRDRLTRWCSPQPVAGPGQASAETHAAQDCDRPCGRGD